MAAYRTVKQHKTSLLLVGKAQIADCPPISTGVLARPKPAEDREGPRLSGNPTARSENSPQRFYSISAQIRQERAAYYDILEQTLRGTLDITPWMEWFLGCLGGAIDGAQAALASVLAKGRFWVRLQGVQLNDRQRLVINRLLGGFEGKLTTSKYAKLAKCSQDTALRDISSLVQRGILVRGPEGGRSTSFTLAKWVQIPPPVPPSPVELQT